MKSKVSQPTISVVVPCHNAQNTIEKTLRAILNQEYACTDIIVVDNNSAPDDCTAEIVASLNSDNIVYLAPDECANGNVARNMGSEVAKGDFIAYCDSDDEWEPFHLKRRVELLNQYNDIQAVYSGAYIQNGSVIKTDFSRPISPDESPVEFLIGKNKAIAQTSSYIVSKSVWNACRWDENLKRHQDYEFFIAVQKYAGWSYLNSPTYTIVWHSDEVRNHDFESYWQFYSKYKQDLSEQGRARYLFTRWKEALLFEGSGYYESLFANEVRQVDNELPLMKRALFSVPTVLKLIWPLVRRYV
jgi:glycosyltransferase involved in cell wall biosynthesis